MWSFFSRDSAKDFPYEIGEAVHGLDQRSIWSLHRAHRKHHAAAGSSSSGAGPAGAGLGGAGETGEVSVFVYDIKSGSDTKLEIAKAAVKKLKTLRHPSVLQFLDSVETDKVLYVATERVEPLGTYAAGMQLDGVQKDMYLAWGIFQITVRVNRVCVRECRPVVHIECFVSFSCSARSRSSTTTAICGTITSRAGRCL